MTEQRTARLRRGKGPEITVPDWWDEMTPSPEQWLEWFLVQSREAQLVLAEFHLDNEQRLAAVRAAVDSG